MKLLDFLFSWFVLALLVAPRIGQFIGQFSEASVMPMTADSEPTPLSDFQEFSEGNHATNN